MFNLRHQSTHDLISCIHCYTWLLVMMLIYSIITHDLLSPIALAYLLAGNYITLLQNKDKIVDIYGPSTDSLWHSGSVRDSQPVDPCSFPVQDTLTA